MKIYCQHKQSDNKQNGVYECDVAILALSEMSLCFLLTPCIDLWQANYFSTNQQKPGTCFQAVFVHASKLYENIHQKAILLREWINHNRSRSIQAVHTFIENKQKTV